MDGPDPNSANCMSKEPPKTKQNIHQRLDIKMNELLQMQRSRR